MKDIIIKDTAGFQLRVKKWECQSPKGLFAVHFVQASKDKQGNIDNESIYEFFMDQNDINNVAKAFTE